MDNRCNLMNKGNLCRCEQWVRYAVENGWISRETSVNLQEVNTRTLQEAKTLKNLQELYHTLYPDITEPILAKRLQEEIKKKEWEIFL